MLPRSKPVLAFLIVLPLVLIAWMWALMQKRPRLVTTLGAPATSLAFSRDGSLLGIIGQDGGCSLWSRDTHQRLALPTESKSVFNVSAASPPEISISADSHIVFASDIPVSSSSSLLYAWDVSSRQIKWSLVSPVNKQQNRFGPSADGKRVVQRMYDTVKVLDVSQEGTPQTSKLSKSARTFPIAARFKERFKLTTSGDVLPQALALSPDDKTLVAVSSDGRLEFWDVATSQKQSLTPPSNSMQSGAATTGNWRLQYSPDARFVALFDGTYLSVWDTQTGKWNSTSVPDASSETALAWMPDSRSLWTGAGSVQQWSVPRLELVRELPVSGPVTVSGDGKLLATRSGLGTSMNGVWTWNIG